MKISRRQSLKTATRCTGHQETRSPRVGLDLSDAAIGTAVRHPPSRGGVEIWSWREPSDRPDNRPFVIVARSQTGVVGCRN